MTLKRGSGPVVLAQPHGGTYIPEAVKERLNDIGRSMEDTDWHIHRLYDGLLEDATVVTANVHRYVIDANRDPEDVSLYPGRNTTALCPTTTFDGVGIYLDGQAPSADEIEQRRITFHQPYHETLNRELERVHQRHGCVILYDCHSIRSNIPYLFPGTLPVFNIGSNDGRSCDPRITRAVETVCRAAAGYDTVVNGRFKGGWTTRHCGRPAAGYHAVQMELAQRAYMQEKSPWTYDEPKATVLRTHLSTLLERLSTSGSELAAETARGVSAETPR